MRVERIQPIFIIKIIKNRISEPFINYDNIELNKLYMYDNNGKIRKWQNSKIDIKI